MKSELGEEATDKETVLKIMQTFYPKDKRSWIKCIDEFNKLVAEQYSEPIKINLDFENKPARYFIRADTYVMLADLCALYNHLTGDNKKDISLALAIRIKNEFLKSVEHFKEKYEWVYSPPVLPGINKHTIGRQLRQEFQEHYGAYSEITYLIAITESISFKKANNKQLDEYLSVGEYLLRKRAVEGVA